MLSVREMEDKTANAGSATGAEALTPIKLGYKGELRRVRVVLADLSLLQLRSLMLTTFQLPENFVIRYTDNEGDTIAVHTEDEFEEAKRVFRNLPSEDVRAMRFEARTSTSIQEHCEPILKNLEDVADAITEAVLRLVARARSEDWRGKVVSGASKTGVAIKESAAKAGREIAQLGRQLSSHDLGKAIRDVLSKHGLDSGAYPGSAMPQQQLLEGPSESQVIVKKEEVEQMPENLTESEISESEKQVFSVAEVENQQQSQEQDEDEWAVLPSSEDVDRWAVEIHYIQEVLPEADEGRIVSLLDQNEGNIQAVLNELIE